MSMDHTIKERRGLLARREQSVPKISLRLLHNLPGKSLRMLARSAIAVCATMAASHYDADKILTILSKMTWLGAVFDPQTPTKKSPFRSEKLSGLLPYSHKGVGTLKLYRPLNTRCDIHDVPPYELYIHGKVEETLVFFLSSFHVCMSEMGIIHRTTLTPFARLECARVGSRWVGVEPFPLQLF